MLTIASTVPSFSVNLSSNERPITLKAVNSSVFAALAIPFPALTSLSPFLTSPITRTGTRPDIAIGGCVSFVPDLAFIKNPGRVEITPKTSSLDSSLTLVISFAPPNITTVPASIGASASKRSAKSA